MPLPKEVVDFLESISWARRANIWADPKWQPCLPRVKPNCSWLTLQSVEKSAMMDLLSIYESGGVSKAYFDREENQWLRDLLVYEFDINQCKDKPTFECVKENFKPEETGLMGLGNPTLYYNGGKSIYVIYLLDVPTPIDWVPKVTPPNIDMNQLTPLVPFRVPYTLHPKTKSRGFAIDWDMKPTDFVLEKTSYKLLLEPPIKARLAVRSGVTRSERPTGIINRRKQGEKWDCLPEWVKALITYLEQTGELCHYGRMAVAGWMLWCGFTDEEIHEVFKHARNYKPHTTQYQINYIRESMLEDGIKPMRCETVIRECNQNKAPNLDCTHH